MRFAATSAGPLQYSDCSDAAWHRQVLLGRESFMAVIAILPGFRSSSVFFEVMHLLWVTAGQALVAAGQAFLASPLSADGQELRGRRAHRALA